MSSPAYRQISLDDAWLMLQHIPATERELWLQVLMALKSEFGDDANSIADAWSQTASNYEPKSFKSVWRSIKSGSGVSIATLYYLAREHGWRHIIRGHRAAPESSQSTSVISDTSTYAKKLWMAASPDDEYAAGHLYAKQKSIAWAGGAARGIATGSIIGSSADCIIVPIRSIQTNQLQGVQCINGKGRKQTFGRVSGGALLLGNTLDRSLIWYVCEGWASAFSMVFHHQNGNGVCACSFGKHNQDSIAQSIADVYQPNEIMVLREVDS